MKKTWNTTFFYRLTLIMAMSPLISCVSSGGGENQRFTGGKNGAFFGPELNARSEKIFSKDSKEISKLYEVVLSRKATGAYNRKINALLAKSHKSSLEEAILSLNLIQTFMASHTKRQNEIFEIPFIEEKAVSLAELAAVYDIDLIDQIENNHFLQSVEVYHLLVELREFYSGEEINQLLRVSVDKKLAYFKEFVTLSEASMQLANHSLKASSVIEEAPDPRSESEILIDEADELLTVNKYHEAMSLLRGVKKGDDFHDLAKQKIASISKKAVEELRRKAALAYQNANHIDTDFRARESYFVKARSLLEKALKLYPEAEQTERVRMNLKVINDNLTFLKKGRLQEG